MKKIKISAILFALLFLAFSLAMPASAVQESVDLVTLDFSCNIMINIAYDVDSVPDVSIVSPTGKVYNKSSLSDGVTYEEYTSEKQASFFVPDAAKGTWRLQYDASCKGHLNVTVIPYARNIEIDYFHLNSISGNQAATSFKVNFNKRISYSYTISAAVLDAYGNVEGTRELYSGSAYSGEDVARNVDLSSLAPYDAYYLYLEVFYDDYGMEITDSALSAKFEVTNGSYSPITDYLVYLDVETGMLTVDWSSSTVYYAHQYNVAVESGGEVVFATSVSNDTHKIENIAVDPASNEIVVSFSYKGYNGYSDIHKVTVHPSEMGIKILTDKLTNSSQAEISYSVSTKSDAYVTVGDSVNEKILLDGSGSFSVPLEEGYNILKVMQIYSENVIFTIEKRILLDRVAPTMEFFENLSDITTDETSFVIVGRIDSGSSFTMNGMEQTVAADGSFSIKLPLKNGVNSFEFIAKDAAGNSAVRTVSITCTTATGINAVAQWFSSEGLVLIIVGAVLVLVAIIIISILAKRKKLTLHRLLTLISIVLALFTTTVAIIMFVQIKEKNSLSEIIYSEQFFEIAKDSIDKANDYLVAYDAATALSNQYLTYTVIAFIVTLISGIADIVICKYPMIKERSARTKEKSDKKRGAHKNTGIPNKDCDDEISG